MPKLTQLRIALVYDRVNKFGGAERVVQSLHKLFPHAPLFTLVHQPKTSKWAKGIKVIPTFFNFFPWLRTRHQALALVAPLAFETFDLTQYDLVITITSESAKAVITKPETLHLCYCLTPTRYLWSGREEYKNNPEMGLISPLVKKILHKNINSLQKRDLALSFRPDKYISISKEVQKRVQKYYKQPSDVIYPPVNYDFFSKTKKTKGKYYLVVSRLVPYKKVDLVVKAFANQQLRNQKLIVVGKGSQLKKLKRLSTPNITFKTNSTDQQLRKLYTHAKAVIFPQVEDFGIVPLEAQSAGTPVLAYAAGGALETVIKGSTGLFFDKQTPSAIINAIKRFKAQNTVTPSKCRKNALSFSDTRFQKLLFAKLESLWQKHQKTFT